MHNVLGSISRSAGLDDGAQISEPIQTIDSDQ